MTELPSLHDALLKHNQQVPRYTSYPTAPHFTDHIDGDTVSNWLSAIKAGSSLSLYFHIPFCAKMCWYCGCNTKATRQYAPVEEYLDYLSQEIDLVANKLSGDQMVKHIHFGGGSPSMLKSADFELLMAKIRSHFTVANDAEIAIELDPREITEAKVAAYTLAGVTRASLGVQDFHEDVQTAINRRQPFHTIYDAVNLLRAYGINEINMDLLYGLPHQTTEYIEENVAYAAALGASRISLFGYAHVPWMKKHMKLINADALPDGSERLVQFDAASQCLEKRGYVPIGLDHFVLPNDPMAHALENREIHRNFQGYTTDAADALIGFGASAISSLPQGYAQNSPANNQYFRSLESGELPTTRGKELNTDDRVRRQIIEQLMCYFKLDLPHFCEKQGIDICRFEETLHRLEKLAADKLITIKHGKIKVHQEARQAIRLVCAAFDTYLKGKKSQHAQIA